MIGVAFLLVESVLQNIRFSANKNTMSERMTDIPYSDEKFQVLFMLPATLTCEGEFHLINT